jgi:hypothetical protein
VKLDTPCLPATPDGSGRPSLLAAQEISAMTTYTALYHTDADYAEQTFDADTPQQALRLAQAFYDQHTEELIFESYNSGMPVNEIEIADDQGIRLAVWRDDDLRLRLAAADLRDALVAQNNAAQAVIDAWKTRDLADAVRALDASIQLARAALAKAKPLAGVHD